MPLIHCNKTTSKVSFTYLKSTRAQHAKYKAARAECGPDADVKAVAAKMREMFPTDADD